VPPDAKSLVLIVDDPDAPDPPHQNDMGALGAYNLPPATAGLREGVAAKDLPAGTLPGLKRLAASRLRRPCRPKAHTAIFTSCLLDAVLQT